MRESPAIAARTMSEQSEALSEAHLMDEGSTMRILEFGRRNEVAEDGARHIVHESEEARRRYHSEPESAVQHIQAQHHEAQETAAETLVNIEHGQTRAQSQVISHRLYNGACGSPVLIDLVFGNLHYFPYYQSIGLV